VVLALGSNLGDRVATLRSAVTALGRVDGLAVERVSPVVETDPVGGPAQESYLNAVVTGRTTLPAQDLLAACQRIELDHDRVRTIRWGPRTLDIDIIVFGTTVSADPQLTLPHPRAHQRAFVLEPWQQVDPEAALPGPHGGPVTELLAAAADRGGLRSRPDIDLHAEEVS
jgi:2-amino-4-hydroxy-6-hydroxymethyldihydropteridine diphosphokinase